MTDGVAGTQMRTYDSLDRLLTLTRGTGTFSYQYDAAGNVTKQTYPDGVVTDYTYDPLGRMASVVREGPVPSSAAVGSIRMCRVALVSRYRHHVRCAPQ